MSFLTIPGQEGLFTAIRTGQSAEQGAPLRADAADDEEEEEDTGEVRLVPRSSPVPRRRGSSIFDETAEYMLIRQALSAGKRVSFADATGGDLVDVQEFHPFESDEEDGSARWQREEAKYREPAREPLYSVRPEFRAPAGGDLLRAVRARRVEVEQVCPARDEPLAFSGLVRVLNVSFHKAVYIRATLDSWDTYFDHPAEYVPGSSDGDTDQFSFKLSFAPPYTTHGSRMEFVVRYESSDGDFWANNSSMNYAVTLQLSYKDEPVQTGTVLQRRSILKPCTVPSVDKDDDECPEEDREEPEAEEPEMSVPRLVRPAAVCPVIVHPEIDVETAVQPSVSSIPLDHRPPSAEGMPSTRAVFQSERLPRTPSEAVLQTDTAFGPYAGDSVPPDQSQPSPGHQSESQSNTLERCMNSRPSALLPAPSLQEGTSAGPPAEGAEGPASLTSASCLSSTEMKLLPTTRDDGSAAEGVSSPGGTGGFETEVVVGSSERPGRLSEVSTKSEAHHVDSTPEPLSPVAETMAPIGAEASPELTENPTANTRSTTR